LSESRMPENGPSGSMSGEWKRSISHRATPRLYPRIRAARERLSKLEEEYKQRTEEEDREAELRLVIGQLEDFASRISEGLDSTSWLTRREIVQALVKRVEVDEEEVRIVYRVGPSPFEGRPRQGLLRHCRGRSGCC
jgi:site-specific DNA recombinase